MNDKNKLTILILIILTLCVLIVWLLIAPAFLKIVNNSKSFLDQKTELVKIQREVSNFENFDTSYDLYYDSINKIEKIILNQILIEKELSLDLIEFLKNEAVRNVVTIKVTPIKIEDAFLDSFKLASFKLNITGKFADCLNFLSRIEHSRWLSEIDNVVITRSDQIVTMNMSLKVYAKK